MNNKIATYLGIIIFGVIFGISIASNDHVLSFFFFVFFLAIFIGSLGLIIIGIFVSKNFIKYGINILILVFSIFITIRITSNELNNQHKDKVENIIAEIKKFKHKNGKVPENLKVINYENELGKLIYSVEKKMNQFTIICLDCDRKYYKYESRTEKWEKFE
jgi:hypothetical protein